MHSQDSLSKVYFMKVLICEAAFISYKHLYKDNIIIIKVDLHTNKKNIFWKLGIMLTFLFQDFKQKISWTFY